MLTRVGQASDNVGAQIDSPSPNPVEVWMTLDEADGLRENVGEALQRYGFDEKYRLTSDGKVLETLMVKLLVQEPNP